MSTVDDLYKQLRVAAALLDSAAGHIRDIPLAPVKENVRHIGEGMASIFEVLRAIHSVRADLVPALLLEPSDHSQANKRLTVAYGDAIRLTDSGRSREAIELLSSYAASESSAFHRKIALDELARLKGDVET